MGRLERTNLLHWQPRTTTRLVGQSAGLEQPNHAVPMRSHRLEQFEHSSVINRLADQRPTDHLRNVIVAHRQRVGITERSLRGLGRRPYPDPRQRHQRFPRPGWRHRHQSLQRTRSLRASDHRPGPTWVDVGAVELPRRNVSPRVRGRWHPHPGRGRSGGGRAVFGHQDPPGSKGVRSRHPLLNNGGDQRF